jgi:hypothetical protein
MYRVFSKLQPYKLPARHCIIDLRKNKRFIIIIIIPPPPSKGKFLKMVTQSPKTIAQQPIQSTMDRKKKQQN